MKVRSEILPLTIETLREAVDDLPKPVLLLDRELRLTHLNTAAQPLFSSTQLWASTWRDPAASDRAACLAPVLLGRACSGAGACEGCLLHDTLARSLARGESVAPLTIERTLHEAGRLRSAAFELTARAVEADGSPGFIVSLRALELARGPRGLPWSQRDRGLDEMRRPA